MHICILYKTYVHFKSKYDGHVQCIHIPQHHLGPLQTFRIAAFHLEMRWSRLYDISLGGKESVPFPFICFSKSQGWRPLISHKVYVISLNLGTHAHTHTINSESTGSMKRVRSTNGFRLLRTLLVNTGACLFYLKAINSTVCRTREASSPRPLPWVLHSGLTAILRKSHQCTF